VGGGDDIQGKTEEQGKEGRRGGSLLLMGHVMGNRMSTKDGSRRAGEMKYTPSSGSAMIKFDIRKLKKI